jgi:3-isopropylmalate/(R)-2-methylmalate dehydratase small subunit
MQKFEVLKAIAAPFPHANVDTDRIIRIERCARVPRHEMGRWAFESARFLENGSDNPEFILNQATFKSAGILVASENFGCGSSREMAVWAIAGMGIRCVIAPSFGEIFWGNCFQNGLLPIRLDEALVANLQSRLTANAMTQNSADVSLTVDLVRQVIQTPWGESLAFEVDPLRKLSLLEGLDPIGVTLKSMAEIEAYEKQSERRQPWLWKSPTLKA